MNRHLAADDKAKATPAVPLPRAQNAKKGLGKNATIPPKTRTSSQISRTGNLPPNQEKQRQCSIHTKPKRSLCRLGHAKMQLKISTRSGAFTRPFNAVPPRDGMGTDEGERSRKEAVDSTAKKFKKRLKNCLLSSAYIWHWKRRRAAPSPPSRGLSLPENCPASASASIASDNRLVGRNSEDEIPRLVHPIFRVRFRST